MASTIDIEFGGKRRISISPMTLVYYDEEFSRIGKEADLLSDFMAISMMSNDITRLSGIKMMRIIWSAEKTYKNGVIEPFNVWVKLLPYINFENTELWEKLSVAITDEFFRSDIETKENQDE